MQMAAGLVTPFDLVLLAVTYSVTLIGVEIGFHRMIAHRGFSARAALRVGLAVFGSMAAQGPLLWWVATHRLHHERSDAPGDPHSPYLIDGQPVSGVRGFAHAHVAWMWSTTKVDWYRYGRDIVRDPALIWINRTYAVWVAAGLFIPAALGAAWYRSLAGAARGLLWGGLFRVFLVHQAMWCVASVCHLYGSRRYRVPGNDQSRNNPWVALVTFGEGWHNNHHAFPSSARHGLEWWQLDVNYLVILVLSALGLVRDVKVPTVATRRGKYLREDVNG
jgi:stearoyl-CoA desaturase (delta-9 desaturase)